MASRHMSAFVKSENLKSKVEGEYLSVFGKGSSKIGCWGKKKLEPI